MNGERPFPLLLQQLRRHEHKSTLPSAVSWGLVAAHEDQALRNHFQTLERLAQRGGLSPSELWAVLHDVPFEKTRGLDLSRIDDDIMRFIAQYEAGKPV